MSNRANGQYNLASSSYVALKRLKVNGVTRNPGDAVPEAATWRNLSSYIASGQLAVVGLASGGHTGVPSGKAKRERVVRATGHKDFTHYGPVDHTGVPSTIPSDAP